MAKKQLDGSVEAVYQDGFVLNETELNDISPYNSDHNILRAIIDKDAEAEHGALVSFSLFFKDRKYTVDWVGLPENARPIRFKRMEADVVGGKVTEVRCMKIDFGYQYNDEDGKNIQEIKEIQ